MAKVAAVLARARRGGKSDVKYVAPDPPELEPYRTFVRRLLTDRRTAPPTDVPDGFDLETLDAEHLALIERTSRRRGASALVVRRGAASHVVIEVPHSFFDEATLPIGLALYESLRARALLVNTVHRYNAGSAPVESSDGDEGSTPAVSDVAHAEHSHFLAAHEAFVGAIPDGYTIQVHGFRDSAASGIDVILSGARTAADPAPIAARLRSSLGLEVASYPSDIRKLGGTTNVQARLSRKLHHPFIHVELSQTLRRRLTDDERLLRLFTEAFRTEAR